MKMSFLILFWFAGIVAGAQRGDELLVYSVKGNVTAFYNNKESAVKIGKVLRQGTIIRTARESYLTMVCKQGRPIMVTDEGSYPISIWRDSCKTDKKSLTSKYFSYVWSELYYRSQEYKEDLEKYGSVALVRGDAPYRYEVYPDDTIVVDFKPQLDTINYVGKNFPLTWQFLGFDGKVQFSIYTAKERKLVFRDSVADSRIFINRFNHKLKPGIRYAWTILAPVKTGVIRRRILTCVKQEVYDNLIDSLKTVPVIAEDSAAKFFRIAYVLEKKHFLAEAYHYYQKAADADTSISLYADRLRSFVFDFRLEDMKTEKQNKTGTN